MEEINMKDLKTVGKKMIDNKKQKKQRKNRRNSEMKNL